MCNSCPTSAAKNKHREQSRIHAAEVRARNKTAVFNAYGGKCRCCGESESAFLCIDHVNDDGAAHRKIIGQGARGIGSGSIMHAWLVRHRFPEGYQILCANCNLAKQSRGTCPHASMV